MVQTVIDSKQHSAAGLPRPVWSEARQRRRFTVPIGVVLSLSFVLLTALAGVAVVLVLLLLHMRFGLTGRRAARVLLSAYLLLSLAYPGVKFVTDVLIGTH